MCLAFSALYELIEWLEAVTIGAAADDFLGTQGDPWDTQTNTMALVGAIVPGAGAAALARPLDGEASGRAIALYQCLLISRL
jgi:uncharacterized membrane protein YjdF